MDVIETSGGPTRPTARLAVVAAIAAIVVAAYAVSRLSISTESAAGPTASASATATPRQTATKPATTVSDDLERTAAAWVRSGPGFGLAQSVIGSSYVNGRETYGGSFGLSGSPDRLAVDMVCLGDGSVVALLSDRSDVDPATSVSVPLTCTAKPGTPVSTQLTMSGDKLYVVVYPDPDTVAVFAHLFRPV